MEVWPDPSLYMTSRWNIKKSWRPRISQSCKALHLLKDCSVWGVKKKNRSLAPLARARMQASITLKVCVCERGDCLRVYIYSTQIRGTHQQTQTRRDWKALAWTIFVVNSGWHIFERVLLFAKRCFIWFMFWRIGLSLRYVRVWMLPLTSVLNSINPVFSFFLITT